MIITKSKPIIIETKEEIMGALAMDLLRVSLGLRRGSHLMAERFKEEVLKRSEELENRKINDYVSSLLASMKISLAGSDQKAAEDALMYSTLFQNFALKN